MGVNMLDGNDVFNCQDEDLGDIKEIMFDMGIGCVVYVVLLYGGFLGMGNKLFVVFWNVLILDIVNKCFVFDVDKDWLENVFGFDKDQWFDMVDVIWSKEIYDYYGVILYLDGRV